MKDNQMESKPYLLRYYFDIKENCWLVELASTKERFYLNSQISEEYRNLADAALLIQNHIKELENNDES